MTRGEQVQRAQRFHELHGGPLLLLPNVWDPLGARLLAHLGFPAVATASAAIAWSAGYEDGELLRFDTMLEAVARVAGAVDLPVTADIERGYGLTPADVGRNVARVIAHGAVGVNLEDSAADGTLLPLAEQCRRLAAARDAALRSGVALFLNARVDAFLRGGDPSAHVGDALTRARAYLDAGASGIYPIGLGDRDILRRIRSEIAAPINVLARAGLPPPSELEAIGVNRLSLGPGMLRAALTTMHRVALELRDRGSYEAFTGDLIDRDEVRRLLRVEPEARDDDDDDRTI